mmetsp:Transcript_29202/g.100710  ORF Transcript_29202/g.100710 Transcript_29202/m.100710 type:complete len:331 (+) Transcript_29202:2277-3269(+)
MRFFGGSLDRGSLETVHRDRQSAAPRNGPREGPCTRSLFGGPFSAASRDDPLQGPSRRSIWEVPRDMIHPSAEDSVNTFFSHTQNAATREPSGRRTKSQRSMTDSAAPLQKRTFSAAPEGRARTPIDLRSRSNSRMAMHGDAFRRRSVSAQGEYSPPACAALNNFSTSGKRAASVGAPTALTSLIKAPSAAPCVKSLAEPICSVAWLHKTAASQRASKEASFAMDEASTPSTPPSRGSYEVPATSNARGAEPSLPPATTTFMHDIWLVVSVPVLSLQITVVHPSVSTDGSLRTIAFCCTILRVPRAKQVVMTVGRPSGMAATANATAILK